MIIKYNATFDKGWGANKKRQINALTKTKIFQCLKVLENIKPWVNIFTEFAKTVINIKTLKTALESK